MISSVINYASLGETSKLQEAGFAWGFSRYFVRFTGKQMDFRPLTALTITRENMKLKLEIAFG